MDSTLSASDVMALTRGNETGFSFGGVGGLILILLFFFIFGGGFWGDRGNATTTGISDLERDVLNGNSATQQAIYTTGCETQKGIMQANYDTLLGFKDAQAQMSQCCCDLKTAIHTEGEATRALVTQNRIADLQDQLDTARAAVANATQTQNILGALGRFVPNPAVPYYYGWGNGTTVI